MVILYFKWPPMNCTDYSIPFIFLVEKKKKNASNNQDW